MIINRAAEKPSAVLDQFQRTFLPVISLLLRRGFTLRVLKYFLLCSSFTT